MEDDKLLEELRAQRELIRKHLEWLDAKIAEQDGSDQQATVPPRTAVAANLNDGGDAPSDSKATEAKSPELTEAKESTPALSDEEDADDNYRIYKAPTGDDVLRAKIGCLILFILSMVLFLFLLFGLPYLLD